MFWIMFWYVSWILRGYPLVEPWNKEFIFLVIIISIGFISTIESSSIKSINLKNHE
jgi:hypothetical protein